MNTKRVVSCMWQVVEYYVELCFFSLYSLERFYILRWDFQFCEIKIRFLILRWEIQFL